MDVVVVPVMAVGCVALIGLIKDEKNHSFRVCGTSSASTAAV